MTTCSISDCDKPPCNTRGWCWGHYRRKLRYGSPVAGRETMEGEPQRWIDGLLAAGAWPMACVNYKFALESSGYARLRLRGGRRVGAHVYVCEQTRGVPDGEVVRHICDNPACINPLHLMSGSYAENTADMLRRGRHVSGFNRQYRSQSA